MKVLKESYKALQETCMKHSPAKFSLHALTCIPVALSFQEELVRSPLGRLGSQSPGATGCHAFNLCKEFNVVFIRFKPLKQLTSAMYASSKVT